MTPAPTPTPEIIFFNGPPGCGKDTAVALLGIYRLSFADQIRRDLAELSGDPRWLLTTAEAVKREVLSTGISRRQGMIHYSEDFIKKVFGVAHFGVRALQRLRDDDPKGPVGVVDSGFRREAEPLISYFGPGNCLIVRVYRRGCDFRDDSRSYWDARGLGVDEVDVDNDGTLDQFLAALRSACRLPPSATAT